LLFVQKRKFDLYHNQASGVSIITTSF